MMVMNLVFDIYDINIQFDIYDTYLSYIYHIYDAYIVSYYDTYMRIYDICIYNMLGEYCFAIMYSRSAIFVSIFIYVHFYDY